MIRFTLHLLFFNFSEWEDIPKNIIDPADDEGWEISTKSRKSRSKIQSTSSTVPTRDVSRESSIVPVIPEVQESYSDDVPDIEIVSEVVPQVIITSNEIPTNEVHEEILLPKEIVALKTEQQFVDTTNSAPTSRKSTLKRSKKKRSSLDGSSPSSGSTSVLSRPVLISDGDYDVASAAAALRVQKNAFDVLDEAKINELKNLKNPGVTLDTLFVSDIGYGMTCGPIGMGRFGLGKYIPPDRSEEIYPIPMQNKDSETNTAENEITSEDSIEDKPGSLTAMLEEVLRNGGNATTISNCSTGLNTASPMTSTSKNSLTTYIRDAARFTELTPHSEETCSRDLQAQGAIPNIPTTEVLIKKKENKEDELDLD